MVAGSGEGGDGVGAQAVDAAGVDDGVAAADQKSAGVVEGEAGLALEDEVGAFARARLGNQSAQRVKMLPRTWLARSLARKA